MKIVIVMPTFNEAQNIERMINALEKVFKKINNHNVHLLIVDGNSPDGTANIVKNASKDKNWLHLLLETEKKGIGAAYFNGFDHAMKDMQADAVIEMDADFQHDPDEIPTLIAPLDEGYDYVIGSRFIKGGSIPKSWNIKRKFLSIGGSIFIKMVLGIFSINDFTSGYKASRVKGFVDQINFNEIKSVGFAYKVELLYRMYKMGAKIKEVPIQFGLRDRGNSKMESDNFMDTLKLVLFLRLNKNKEFVKFCIVGGTGFITDAGIFNILGLTSTSLRSAALISGFTAMVVTFLLNNSWSFKTRKKSGLLDMLKSFPVYVLVSFIPIIFRSYIVSYSVILFGRNFWVYNSAFIIGVILGLVWNYFIYSKVLWRRNNYPAAELT